MEIVYQANMYWDWRCLAAPHLQLKSEDPGAFWKGTKLSLIVADHKRRLFRTWKIQKAVISFDPGFDKFNICVHWFSCTSNGSVFTFTYAKLCVHKTVIVAATSFDLQFADCPRFPYIFCYQLTLKNISWGYVQHKGFSCFNWMWTSELKIVHSRKLR